MKLKSILIFCLMLLPSLHWSCAAPRSEAQEQEYQEQEEIKKEAEAKLLTLFEEVRAHNLELAELMEKSWGKVITPEETARLAELLGYAPAELQLKIAQATDLVNEWWVANDRQGEIDEEAGGWGWPQYAGIAGAGLALMGMPTSGPFAPYLAWLARFLEATKLRNADKRQEYHAKAYGPTGRRPDT